MTHFKDLTPYSYGVAISPEVDASNIGWLAEGFAFPATAPDPQFVDRLWRFCKIAVGQTRGLHECEPCHSREANVARRNGEELLLGSAEIRVVGDHGQLYAAPNLIHHYVVSHNYSPPPQFVRAVLEGPCPPEDLYFELLSKPGLTWRDARAPEPAGKPFRFVKTSQGIVKVEE